MILGRLDFILVQEVADLEMYRQLHQEKNTLITKIDNCTDRFMQFPDPPVVVPVQPAAQANPDDDDEDEEDDDDDN